MGTNYYWHARPACETCGRNEWCFGLHVYPHDERAINTLDDWERLWREPGSYIVDEYGDQINNIREIISEREGKDPTNVESWEIFS